MQYMEAAHRWSISLKRIVICNMCKLMTENIGHRKVVKKMLSLGGPT
jgi:hypothetical protein